MRMLRRSYSVPKLIIDSLIHGRAFLDMKPALLVQRFL